MTVDTIWFDLMKIGNREHKIDLCNASYKTQNKIRRCNLAVLTLPITSTEVINNLYYTL